MFKVYNDKLEKNCIKIEHNILYIDNSQRDKIANIFYTVYSTGEVLSKTSRNYLNIHIYDYLYEFTITLNNGERHIFYTKNRKQFIQKLLENKKIKSKTRYQVSFFQDYDLPIVKLVKDNQEVLLKKRDFTKDFKYLYQKFPKLTFKAINIYGENYEDDHNLVKFTFQIKSATNFYKCIFLIVIFISAFTLLLYTYIQKEFYVTIASIAIFSVVSVLMFIFIALIHLLEKAIIRKFKKKNLSTKLK